MNLVNINKKKLLIFDCDGVLFDSVQANLSYFKKCLEILDYPLPSEALLKKVSYFSIFQLFNELLQDIEKAEHAFTISQTISYDPFLKKMKPLFNFESVLVPLREKYQMAVASNRSRSLQKVFTYFNLETYFNYRISVLDAKAKPDPDMLIKCIRYFNVTKEESIFIGDAKTDKQAADSASIDYISISTGDDSALISCKELINILL